MNTPSSTPHTTFRAYISNQGEAIIENTQTRVLSLLRANGTITELPKDAKIEELIKAF